MKEEGVTMIKKILIVIFILALLLTMGGCGKKLSQKIEENITEEILNADNEGGKVDIDGDEISIKSEDGEMHMEDDILTVTGEDGEVFTIGETVWPEGKAADLIPTFTKGTIMSVMNSDELCMVMFEEVEEKAFKDYIEETKEMGFTNDTSEYSLDDMLGYSAYKNEDTVVSMSYMSTDKQLTISVQIMSED